jgi:hypothetical protein
MKWEYKTIKLGTQGWFSGGILDDEKLEAMMNSLGDAGWELVAAFDTNQAYGQTRDVVVIFKKEKA